MKAGMFKHTSLFSSSNTIYSKEDIVSSCCSSSQTLPDSQNDQPLKCPGASKKKISLATIKNKKCQQQSTRDSRQLTDVQNNVSREMIVPTVFINNFVVPPPLITVSQRRFYQPIQPQPQYKPSAQLLESLRSERSHQTLNSTRIPILIKQQISSRSTVPQSKISCTQIHLESAKSLFSTCSGEFIKSSGTQEENKGLFEQFKIRCTKSKRLLESETQVKVEESQVMIEFFNPKDSIVSQTSIRR